MNSFAHGHALIIGINDYPHINPLPNVVIKDTSDLKTILTNPQQCGYPADQVHLLLNEQATSNNIRTYIQTLAKRITSDDTVVIFFSGHGWRTPDGQQNYLITYDSRPDEAGKLAPETAINGEELTSLLRQIQAGRLVVLFDCCHAGGTGETKEAFETNLPGFKAGLAEHYYDQLKKGQGRVIMASCREDELSWILPGMKNSLFTHHLLEALGGQVPSIDGVIRVFDLFRYISKAMPQQYPNQHPIFKSHLEDDFAIALSPLNKQPTLIGHQKKTHIEDPKNLLPQPKDQTTVILRKMFADYDRVIIEAQFGGGFSGSYVFKVKPIKAKTTAKSVVIKIASVGQTEQEQQGYQIIRDHWSQLMRVEDQLVISPDDQWAGIRYQMAGDDLFDVKTLLDFVYEHEVNQINALFKKQLIPLLEQAYRNTLDTEPEAYWYSSYTQLLPKNLVINATTPPSTEPIITINADQLPIEAPKAGQYVQLDDFEVEKINLAGRRLSLTLQAKNPWQAYTVWVNEVRELDDYMTGKVAPTITGRVIKNREDWLFEEAHKVLGATVDLNQPTLTVTDEIELANPLHQLHQILTTRRSMRTAHLHGDLNLANILVTDTEQIQFIDFASARKDYVFHDYLRLEAGIITKIVPHLLYQAGRTLHPEQVIGTLCIFYGQLHQAIAQPTQDKTELPYPELTKPFEILYQFRQSAQHFLVQPNDWTEYYHGLVIYLLGALRFPDLEQIEGVMTSLPKQVVWAAAAVVTKGVNLSPSQLKTLLKKIKSDSEDIKVGGDQTADEPKPKPIIPPDMYTPLERGVERLLKLVPYDSPHYMTVATQKHLLEENLKEVRQIFDTSELRATRAKIRIQLDKISLDVTGKPFDQLCDY